MNTFVNDIIERIAIKTSHLAYHNKQHTNTRHEIKSAVRLHLSGEFSKHAFSKGTLSKYTSKQKLKDTTPSS